MFSCTIGIVMRFRQLLKRIKTAPQGELYAAHKDTGVPYETIRQIRVGKTTNPRIETVEKLVDWYVKRDAAMQKAS